MEPARPSPTRVVLVDDQRLVVEALARLLATEPDISVVATAGSLRDLESGIPDFDVAIVDYLLPDGTGVEATRLMKRRLPEARVVILSAVTDDYAAARATNAGADAYLGKGVSMAELLNALRHAASLRRGEMPAAGGTGASAPDTGRLTRREMDVLRALALGHTTRQICAELGIGQNTVRTHVQNLIAKLHVHSRIEAVALALRERLV